ncbi:DNA translocase FtsK [Urbifossiella limnaea]|uniref:DNA translocase FtsK n=1 Tax=Urbifossiella limnaea TaxID=2528023 RepID=A0A517XLL2_9BACT|nr:DNA translocase FtsK [Urbifossiella limnaea]QDU18356.1 DNA translocase FtsK [Urbifossiella limnaea]
MADDTTPDSPPTPRWRLDAVVLTLAAVGAALAVAVGSGEALAGGPNVFGAVGDSLAALVVEPLGWAAPVFLAGWFAVAAQLVLTRNPLRVVTRVTGWLILAVAAAAWADGARLPPAAVAGAGGSVGAFVRLELDDATVAPWELVVLAGAALVGLVLAAHRLVFAAARGVWAGLRLAWRAAGWVNEKVGDASAALLGAGWRAARAVGRRVGAALTRDPKPPVAATPAAVPITRPTVYVPEPEPESDTPRDTHVEDIPIHSHADPHDPAALAALLRAVAPEDDTTPYELPPLSLLADPEPFPVEDHAQKLREMAVLLEKTFTDFGLTVKVVGIHTGPVITQYEIALETGLRLNKVTNLADDLALNLRVPSVRVVAPLPGRNTVGIEVPNEIRQTVCLKEVVGALAATPKVAKYKLPMFVGKDVEGRALAYDLAAMPHLLIAGRTGTGKSVCLNTIIVSLLLSKRPDECRMILIDPKKVELSDYAKIPHLMTPVVKDPKKAEAILAWAVDKMEERYEWLHRARVRNIASYNELPFEEVVRRINPDSEEERRAIPRSMPYIMILIDEVGDLMMQMKKEIEGSIILLAQKSRAAGIHLILATQKPTVDVITGLIKSNLPARICFQVTNRSDSAVVLDEKGADKLLGRGDMLLLQNGSLLRAQGAYVGDREIEAVVDAVATDTPNYDSELLNLKTRDQADGGEVTGEKLRERDPQYEQAVEIVIREQRGSTSLLQRALGIGYGKASRLIDYMAEDGIVGGFNGSNARQVLVTPDEWAARKTAG